MVGTTRNGRCGGRNLHRKIRGGRAVATSRKGIAIDLRKYRYQFGLIFIIQRNAITAAEIGETEILYFQNRNRKRRIAVDGSSNYGYIRRRYLWNSLRRTGLGRLQSDEEGGSFVIAFCSTTNTL